MRWCVLLKSETGAILMLLYLTSALFFRCLKIAVNYKCSLNVSSDPEMQVGMRQIVCLIWNRCIFTEHSEFSLPSVSSSWVISIRYWAGLVLCYEIPHIWTAWKKSRSIFCACVCVCVCATKRSLFCKSVPPLWVNIVRLVLGQGTRATFLARKTAWFSTAPLQRLLGHGLCI